MSSHPLDRPVWNAFAGRQAAFAIRDGDVLRVDPGVGLFASALDDRAKTCAGLAALADAGGLALVGSDPSPPIEGLTIVKQAPCHQMVAKRPVFSPPAFAFDTLGADDAVDMLRWRHSPNRGRSATRPTNLAALSVCASKDGWSPWRASG